MAEYDVTVGKDLLPGLLNGQDGLAKLIERVLNQVLEAQVVESLNAERYESHEERAGYRNGYRMRQLYTSVGPNNVTGSPDKGWFVFHRYFSTLSAK